jgi:ankyrin repeat protein
MYGYLWLKNKVHFFDQWVIRSKVLSYLVKDAFDKNGYTALHHLCKNRELTDDILSDLILGGIDIDCGDIIGNTPLMLTAQIPNLYDYFLMFIDKGAKINKKNMFDQNALMIACKYGNKNAVSTLLLLNAKVNDRDYYNETALDIAISEGFQECALCLLERHDIDLTFTDKDGENVLMQSAFRGFHNIVFILVEMGFPVDKKNNDGNTALMLACAAGDPLSVEILLSHDADINLKNKYRETALIIACKNGNDNCVDILLRNEDIEINVRGPNLNTALFTAVSYGHDKCVELLLKHGADLTLRNAVYETPFGIAMCRNHKKCVQLLREALELLGTKRRNVK